MTVLPGSLERQLVRAAGGAPSPPNSEQTRSAWVRGAIALAAGVVVVGLVVLVFVTAGAQRPHTRAAGQPAPGLDPTVPATYRQACAQTSDCLTVPPGAVPAALRRPFRVAQLPSGQACPTTGGTRFQNSEIGGVELGSAPVRPAIGNRIDPRHGRIILGTTEVPGWYGIKIVWYSLPSYGGPWSVRAARLSGAGRIELGPEPAPLRGPARTVAGPARSSKALVQPPGDTLNSGDGYRTEPTTTWISRPGCYAWQVAGLGFSQLIVFQALPPLRTR